MATPDAGQPEAAPVRSVLEMLGVSKRFGGLQALDDVSITLPGGQVLGLCGANGAGKSTLVKVLAGAERPDRGRVLLDGKPLDIDRPQKAADAGLSVVHQELSLVPKFTGLQNMALCAGRQRLGLLDRVGLRRRAEQVQDLLGYRVPLDTAVEQLSTSDRWMVALGRSLMRPARFVAMDEPTASFTAAEAQRCYRAIRELTASGVGVLYVSHRLEEVLQVCDQVTVLRNGALVGTHDADQLTVPSLTRHIVGHDIDELTAHRAGTAAARRPVRLAVRGLRRAPRVTDISFDLHEGEVLGLAGLVGAGRTETARMLVGAERPSAGTVTLDGEAYAPRSPHDAIRAAVALVPEERRSQGLILGESIETNLSLASHGKTRRLSRPFGPRQARRAARALTARLQVKTDDVRRPVLSLSGGNQQKVLIGNYLQTAPRVLILDEPTVGVDVGARSQIYDLVAGLAAEGTSILLISSDFDELAMCDRVLVLRGGLVVADVPGARATKNHLTSLCFQSEQASA